ETTPEDAPLNGTLTATDVDGDPLTFSKASDPAHGTVTVRPDGTYTYTPAANYNGPDSFTYTVSDGHGGTVTKTVAIVVTPVNDAPAVSTITPPASKDGDVIRFDVSTLITDVDGDTPTFTATGLPPGLSIDPTTGLITGRVTKDASQGGPYTVTLTVDDGHGGVVTKTFAWPVTNPPPVAADDSASVRAGEDVTVNVLTNDSDPDGDPLVVTKAQAGNGTVEIRPDGSIKYTPRPGFAGTDRITYVISDGNGGFAIASVTITVADNGYSEKPPVFGFNGPEQPDNNPADAQTPPHTSITADGAVVDAVFDIGELRSIAGQLSADGVVLSAANGVRSLQGIGSIGANGVIVEAMRAERAHEILLNAGFDRGFQEYRIEGLPGFSLRNNVPGNLGGLSAREQVIIESLVRDDTLIIQISNTLESGNKRIVEYRVIQSNGAPLPEWLDRAGRDLLIGRRDANTESLSLKVEAVYSDGTVVVEEVKIDTATGEISPLKTGRQGSLAPRMFADQFHAPSLLSLDQIEHLGRAISR
ncbi:MAG: Ig-like domain-containing protein, partial [Hyphomicrobium sp.]